MMRETWESRDLPVLKAVVEIFIESGETSIDAGSIYRRTGMDKNDVQRALRALYAEPYLDEKGKMAAASGELWYVGAPTGAALRVAGAWPTPEALLDRLVCALETAGADEHRDEEERSKFKRAALWLGGFGSQVAITALGGAGGTIISS
ncbi:MAG: hypothetical protein PGN27_04300 [Mycolicibacterium neoaurum]|uniref:hypothetical protein n=1 Tax=Mycolicibacterium neoaurum TaxID=1795 RepID=UPI002FFC057D